MGSCLFLLIASLALDVYAHEYGQHGRASENWLLIPTVFPAAPFDARADAVSLMNALEGHYTDTLPILNILPRRTVSQRLEIAKWYQENGTRMSLWKALSTADLSGDMKRLCTTMVEPMPAQLSRFLRYAMDGGGTYEDELTEVLCSTSNAMIKDIIKVYGEKYPYSLETEIEDETSGALNHLLTLLLTASRNESSNHDSVNEQKVAEDVAVLYNRGSIYWSSDYTRLNQVLALRSVPHIRRVFKGLEANTGKTIKALIEEQFKEEQESGFVACVGVINNPHTYFAEALHATMAGGGTYEEGLIRIALSRAEIDLGNIVETYQNIYRQTAISRIEEDVDGSGEIPFLHMLVEIYKPKPHRRTHHDTNCCN